MCSYKLVLIAGAVVDISLFSVKADVTMLVMVEPKDSVDEEEVGLLLRSKNLATLVKNWLYDTLCDHSIKPILLYTMGQYLRMIWVLAGYNGTLVG